MANPAINAAVLAAAQAHAAGTKAIVDQLKEAGATGPRKATTVDLSAAQSEAMLAYLVKHGHVRDVGGGRYWLDEDAVARSKAKAGRIALIFLAFLISVTASIAAIALSR